MSDATHRVAWLDEEHLECGGAALLSVFDARSAELESTRDQFILVKSRHMIDWYETRFAEHEPGRVLEVGIFKGGSVVLFEGLWNPERLVAVDIMTERVAALDEFVGSNGLGGRVRLRYGIDQADAAAMRSVIGDEFADAPLDLVIDDGCHYLDETKATFDAVFPYVRPGGTYVIEDWAWAHWPGLWQENGGPWADKPAASFLVFELAMLSASRPDLVDSVEINSELILVHKAADAHVEPGFSLSSSYMTAGRIFVEEGFSSASGQAAVLAGEQERGRVLESRVAKLESALEGAVARAEEVERVLRAVETSVSWKITVPLRRLKGRVRR